MTSTLIPYDEMERLIVLGAVALLFAVFEGLQLSYLFGNAPALAGSGITFAEYARRGFAELTVVASLCALLILGLERGARSGSRERAIRGLALAVIALLWVLLVSAFRRLWLYEEAYGFTTARLYAQVYMVVVAGEPPDAGDRPRPRPRRAAAAASHGGGRRRHGDRAQSLEPRGLDRAPEPRAGRTGWPPRRPLPRLGPVGQRPPCSRGGPATGRPSGTRSPRLCASVTHNAPTLVSCRWFEWNLRQRQAADALRAARIPIGPAPAPAGLRQDRPAVSRLDLPGNVDPSLVRCPLPSRFPARESPYRLTWSIT